MLADRVKLVAMLLALFPALVASTATSQESPAAVSGFDESEVRAIEDEKPLTRTDPNLIRLLYRAAKTSDRNFRKHAAQNSKVTLPQIAESPRQHRLQVFRLRGRVQKFTPMVGSQKLAESGDGHPFCMLTIVDESGKQFLVAVPVKQTAGGVLKVNAPKNWLNKSELNQPVELNAYYLANFDLAASQELVSKTTSTREALRLESDVAPTFVTNRIRWFPDQTNESLGVHADHVLLASQGVDLTALDIVARNNNRQMRADESEYFYQLIRATKKITPDQLQQSLGFEKLLQSPGDSLGRSVSFEGRVRRATRVQISDSYQASIIGANHYFMLDLIVPLGDSKIVVNTKRVREGDEENGPDGKTESPSITYDNRFPVTVCVGELPCSEKDLEKQNVLINGFFFRLWNYPSEYVDQHIDDGGQTSPLIIGLTPTIRQSQAEEGRSFLSQMVFGLAAAIMLLGIFAMWYLRHTDSASKARSKEREELPDEIGPIDV